MKESAGIILVNESSGIKKVLLLRAFCFWDFPKGGIECNENKICAALRELKEETGIGNIEFSWGKVFYTTEAFGKDRKKVHYFIAKSITNDIVLEKNPVTGIVEHEDFKWVTFGEAKNMTVERIRKAIDWAEKRINNYE